MNIPQIEVSAEWDKFGKLAGPKRNKKILESYKPEILIAFPGGAGTANMVNLANQYGVKVIHAEAHYDRKPYRKSRLRKGRRLH